MYKSSRFILSSRLHCIFFVAVSRLNPFRCGVVLLFLHTILRNSFVPIFVPRSLLCLDLSSRVLGSFPALSLDFFCFLSSAFACFVSPFLLNAKYLYNLQLPVKIIYTPTIARAQAHNGNCCGGIF